MNTSCPTDNRPEWQKFYDTITLTKEEEQAALLEGRIKKYFRDKNKDYWKEKADAETHEDLP